MGSYFAAPCAPCAQLATLLLRIAVGNTGGGLPTTLGHLLLECPPLRTEAALELASKLPLLRSYQLVGE